MYEVRRDKNKTKNLMKQKRKINHAFMFYDFEILIVVQFVYW